MRILLILKHTGFMRHYETVVEGLALAGHQVLIAYNPDGSKSQLGIRAIDELCRRFVGVTHQPFVERTGYWAPLTSKVRALRDYLRYLHPRYAGAPKLAERARRHAGMNLTRFLALPGMTRPSAVAAMTRLLQQMERLIPVDGGIEAMVRAYRPDAVLVSPLIDLGSGQADYLKAAQRLGIPTAVCVASWDNLTNKGSIQIQPDRVILWNGPQRDEAVELHGVAVEDIRVTGAQSFDIWFERQPSTTRSEFCARVGLDPDRPMLLYLGSSRFIAEAEPDFVVRWLRRLRGADDSLLRSIQVLVRPHPLNVGAFAGLDLTELDGVVWPRAAAYVTDAATRADYFDTLYHSAAVVGVNTSGFIEAGIVGKVSHTIRVAEYSDTQDGTLHFAHLLRHGFVKSAADFPEHLRQLGSTLRATPMSHRAHVAEFLRSFVRPQGLDQPSTPLVVDAIEELVGVAPRAAPELSPLERLGQPPLTAVAGAFYATTLLRARWRYTLASRSIGAAR